MDTKETIISTAHDLFLRYGFKRITMDHIAQELGISKKTIYQFFRDKKELVLEATKVSFSEEEKMINETAQQSSDAVHELFLVSQYIRNKMSKMHPFILLDLKRYYRNAWKLFEECKDEIFESHIYNLLVRGISEGYFRGDIDPKILAVMRMNQVETTFDQDVFPADQFDFKDVQVQLLDHFVYGILTEKGRKVYNEYIQDQVEHEA